MWNRLAALGGVAGTLMMVTAAKPHKANQQPSRCGPTGDVVMRGLLAEAKHMVATPRLKSIQDSMRVPAVDSAVIRPIQSDSLCILAARTINRSHGGVDSSRTIYLVQLGHVFWAEDTTIRAGEYVQTFILDSTLTTILSKPFR